MKKRGKGVLPVLSLLLALSCLSGCAGYVSHFRAVGYVHSNRADTANMIFVEFEGTEVFKCRARGGKTVGIRYAGKLEEGSLSVCYDCGEGKEELFSLGAGEEVDATLYVTLPSKAIYILVETNAPCQNGDLSFKLLCD